VGFSKTLVHAHRREGGGVIDEMVINRGGWQEGGQ
jgi:hypothetical protein